MNKLLKRFSGITLGLALCFGFSFSCSNKSSQMARAAVASGTNISLSSSPDKSTSNGTQVSPIRLDTDLGLQLSVNKTGNNGKWYGGGTEWRLYQSNNAVLTLTISSDYYLNSVKFTYGVSNNGVLKYGNDKYSSGTEITLPGNSNTASFDVVNTGSATNGQVKLTAAQVWYSSVGGGTSYTSYNVTVHYNDGVTANGTIASSTSNGKISKPADPSRDGYEFVKWCSDESLETDFDFTSVIEADCDMYAKWNKVTPKLAAPAPVFDSANKQVTWANVEHASSYDIVVDNGSTIHNATSPYSVSSLQVAVSHTVKVTAIGDGTNYLDSDTGSVSFAFLNHAGTEADPYTVADARLAIVSNFGKTGVYATGKVSQIAEAYNSQYGNISYDISADGSTNSDQLRVYRGKGINGESFTSETDIEVGDVVVVKGNLTLYTKNNVDTYEFAQDNQLVSIVKASVKELDSLVIDGEMNKTTYTANEQWNPSGITVTAIYDDNSMETVTDRVTWSYSYATPAEMGVTENPTELIVTAHFMGDYDEIAVMVNVEPSTIVDTYHLSGKKLIYETHGNVSYYMNIDNASGSVYPDAVTSKAQASIFVFTLVGDDTYTITNEEGTKGLYHTGNAKDNKVLWGSSGLTYHWVINNTKAGELTGTYNLIGQTTESKSSTILDRYLCVYNESDWRTYSSATAGNRQAMIDLASPAEVTGFSVYSEGANKDVLRGSTFDATAAAQAGFQARLNYNDNSFADVTSYATWTLDTSTVGTKTLTVTYSTYPSVSFNDMKVYNVAFTSLEIDASNAKTTGYFLGDTLDTNGLVVQGNDGNGNLHSIELEKVTFSPTTLETVGTQTITASYTNDDNTVATGTYSVSVAEFVGYDKVTSLSDINVGSAYVVASPSNGKVMGPLSGEYMTSLSSVFNNSNSKLYSSLPSGTVLVTFLSAGDGLYNMYDIENDRYFYLNPNGSKVGFVSTSEEATDLTITFDDNGQIIIQNNVAKVDTNVKRVLGFNYNNGNAPRFASYESSYNSIALYKVGDSSLVTAVTGFVNEWLKMNDTNYEGNIETESCAENYWFLKEAYYELSEAKKNVLQFNADFAPARARLNAWATANGETFTYGAEEPFKVLKGRGVFGENILTEDNNNTVLIIFMIGTLGVSALSATYLFKRKRKEQ